MLLRDSCLPVPLTMDPGIELLGTAPIFNTAPMRILLWNYRGAGNKRFRPNIRELVRLHDPQMLVLIETKISG